MNDHPQVVVRAAVGKVACGIANAIGAEAAELPSESCEAERAPVAPPRRPPGGRPPEGSEVADRRCECTREGTVSSPDSCRGADGRDLVVAPRRPLLSG